ncbi:TlpA family protein disulfide reductase [Brucella anthropi]|uniref:peroxiredoxin family protein n=1 Tax=Brucella anthropi TaxID=529 RepID=UPI00124F310B|nr:TlpA family protein disulfide reductase [Brucella anthropi]KAB2787206.1 TlpA family protein disulfide reductase [Brucella anthropi]QOD66540.1 TlpA family protein disulfide reductase [Ochrobactrum sp. MT180101]
METGIVGLLAPQLKNVRWIDENGEGRSPLTLDELGHGIRILYFFQDWCPGCHTHGFPTFVKLVDRLHGKGVGFAVIQTVFEGSDVNTFDRLRANQLRYRLRVPFGHAGAISSYNVPNIMEAYRSGGTPWFVVIEPDARVGYNGFQINVESFIQAQ